MKSLILTLVALVLAYQRVDKDDERKIKQLEAQRDALLKENEELNDPELKRQIDEVIANAQAQPPDTVKGGDTSGSSAPPSGEEQPPAGSGEPTGVQPPGGTSAGDSVP